jgi:hypothetical protein
MYKHKRAKSVSALSAVVFCLIAGTQFPYVADAQGSSMQNMLDQVSGSFPSAPMQAQPQYSAPQGWTNPQQGMQSSYGQPYPQGYAQPYPQGYGQPYSQASAQPIMSPFQRLRSLYGGSNGAPVVPLQNPRQTVFQTLFGGGSTPGGSSGVNAASAANASEKLQIARDNLSTARNEQARARNAASRANSGSDKSARQEAASSAQYAASAARAAADRATAAGYNGGPAGDIAAQARNAADDAQASADRASSNANGGGW